MNTEQPVSYFEWVVDSVSILGELFGRNLSTGAVLAYVKGLIDLDPERLKEAFSEARRTCQFMPTVANLRILAGVETTEVRAARAWGEFEQAASIGPYKSVDFADLSINATIRNLGGWPLFLSRLANATEEKWARKEFMETYATYVRDVGYEAGRPLPGISQVEVTNGVTRDVRVLRIETARQDVPRVEVRRALVISDDEDRPRLTLKDADDS